VTLYCLIPEPLALITSPPFARFRLEESRECRCWKQQRIDKRFFAHAVSRPIRFARLSSSFLSPAVVDAVLDTTRPILLRLALRPRRCPFVVTQRAWLPCEKVLVVHPSTTTVPAAAPVPAARSEQANLVSSTKPSGHPRLSLSITNSCLLVSTSLSLHRRPRNPNTWILCLCGRTKWTFPTKTTTTKTPTAAFTPTMR